LRHDFAGLKLTWLNGTRRPPKELLTKAGIEKWSDQGSVYIGEKGVMSSPYIAMPTIRLNDGTAGEIVKRPGTNHYFQFLDACTGVGTTSAPFSYAGPLTEMVLLGCLATRFTNAELQFDAKSLTIPNHREANRSVSKTYRDGWMNS
jgi:hypothetical protein